MTEAAVGSATMAIRRDERRSVCPYRLDICMNYENVAPRWRRMAERGGARASHSDALKSSWYATPAARPGVLPLMVTVVDSRDGHDIMALPLVRREIDGLRVIEFADGQLTDCNAPIVGPGAPRDAHGAAHLWRLLRASLPAADILRLEKMPRHVDGAINPLALAAGVRVSGNVLSRLGAVAAPLCEIETALSWRGVPRVVISGVKAKIRSTLRLAAMASRPER